MPEPARPLLPTGEFSRQTGLSLKALRIYEEIGLLKPADVGPATGRRGYGHGQIRVARLIGMLRGAAVSLAGIGLLLDDLRAHDQENAVTRLDRYLSELEQRHASRRFLITHLKAILREEEPPMFPIRTRHVAAQRVMSIQRRLRAPQTEAFLAEAKAAFAAHLDGTKPTGPFTPITKAQWDYPAILAAYDAVACSAEVTARPRSSLSCREVYVAEPDAIGPGEIVCDIAYPLG